VLGSSRILDVMDVTTQRDLEMTVKDWVRYYENPVRKRLLNVISLEFSHTQLENYVDQPEVVLNVPFFIYCVDQPEVVLNVPFFINCVDQPEVILNVPFFINCVYQPGVIINASFVF